MADEVVRFVAVFIDFENLRYGMVNNYGQEPDFRRLVEKVMKYGRPSVMRAYADFTEHPDEVTRQLQIAGIEAINVPVKRTTYSQGGKSVERIKNAADMVLALDAVNEAWEAETNRKSKIFLLVTGDRDYVKLVTLLRYRFGQKVVIIGVPGTVAGDLVAAAGEDADLVEVPAVKQGNPVEVKKKLVAMIRRGPAPLSFWSLKIIDQWAQNPRQAIPGTAREKRDAIGELVKEGVLVQSPIDYRGRTVNATTLKEEKAGELGYLA